MGSLLERLSKLVVEVARSLKFLNAFEVFLLLHDTIVKLLLNHSVLLLGSFKFISAFLHISLDDLLNVLKIVQ